ncbi:MAG: putative glycoside hydrolase [Erysipelotrichaceae bacterium]|nr:putative glycoside hydrolase [Erysipelotrichaceae bacterium]
MKKRVLLVFIIFIFGVCSLLFDVVNKKGSTTSYYLAGDQVLIELFGEDDNVISLPRGTVLNIKDKTVIIDGIEYRQFLLDDDIYYVLEKNLVSERNDCVLENKLYTLRNCALTSDYDSYEIVDYLFENQEVDVTGFHELLEDGTVDYYYVNNTGYMSGKYLASNYEDASLDASIYNDVGFNYGGDPTKIKYYKKDEVNFVDNKMPDIVRALYINANQIWNIDSYIELAKRNSNINAFVVDIKDCYIDTQLAYYSEVALSYAPSISNIPNTYDEYKEGITKLKDAGYYVIGRITTFKDDAFANDNIDEALMFDGDYYTYSDVKWPSIYSRKAWEYNVALALEAVNEMGFNEIQFDYVRLPESVTDVDLRNIYDEDRLEAICNFLNYAKDKLHEAGAYISADVFGETSGHNQDEFSCFVSNYGQFWPAISNIVDAISSMPYPDHFAAYSYDIAHPWEDVYDLMYSWGKATYLAQENTYYPAKCRTWIQAQDSNRYGIEYTSDYIIDQIQGLKDADIYDGFMTWNAASSLSKYESYIDYIN